MKIYVFFQYPKLHRAIKKAAPLAALAAICAVSGVLFLKENFLPRHEIEAVQTVAHYDMSAAEEISTAVYDTLQDGASIPTFSSVAGINAFDDLQKYLYTIDKTAYVTENDLNIQNMLATDMRTEISGKAPKILIFHTHSQEAFIDSRPGVSEDSIVGVGQVLAGILAAKYHVPVVHDKGVYDFVDGREDRADSYQNMEPAVKKILEKYPSIEIAIDMHRDGVPDNVKFTSQINGKQTARIMFFNGITKVNANGEGREPQSLVNPYLQDNLALSLAMQLTANELYPGFARKIYIKPYRYSLHLLPKSMLVEVGANTNTVEEAKNAMEPLARILYNVFEAPE